MVVMSNALCLLSAAECGTQFDSCVLPGKGWLLVRSMHVFPTNKVPSDKIRDNETVEEHFQNLEWWSGRHWKRRVRAAERSLVHLGRFQANLESEVPVASLIVLT